MHLLICYLGAISTLMLSYKVYIQSSCVCVSHNNTSHAAGTPNAYILFYQRRVWNGGHTGAPVVATPAAAADEDTI